MENYQIVFGLGELYVKDNNGNAAKIATLSEFSFNVSEDEAELYGRSKFPLDRRGTKGKVEGKIKVSAYEPMLASLVMAGSTSSVGYEALADEEPATIPATPGPYTVTVTHSSSYKRNWGVKFAATGGLYLLKVTGTPTTGQYAVDEATGIYTFAAADQGKSVLISYQYGITGSGTTLEVTNVAMGTSTTCSLLGYRVDEGKVLGYYFPTARVKGFAFNFGADKHMQPEHDFAAFAAPGAVVYKLYMA